MIQTYCVWYVFLVFLCSKSVVKRNSLTMMTNEWKRRKTELSKTSQHTYVVFCAHTSEHTLKNVYDEESQKMRLYKSLNRFGSNSCLVRKALRDRVLSLQFCITHTHIYEHDVRKLESRNFIHRLVYFRLFLAFEVKKQSDSSIIAHTHTHTPLAVIFSYFLLLFHFRQCFIF